MRKTTSNTKNNKKQSKDEALMKNSNTKNNKQSQEKTMGKNAVTTDSAATNASVTTCNTVGTDASNTENESSMYLISPYAEDKCYYFEEDPIFQRLIEHSDNKIAYRISTMLYADCISWRKQTDRFFELEDTIIDRFDFGKELIKFGYSIIARRDLLYAMFVKDDTAEVKKIRCPEDVKSYTIKKIIDEIEYMYLMIDDTVAAIIEYGYKNPEVIFAMEVVNSYVM